MCMCERCGGRGTHNDSFFPFEWAMLFIALCWQILCKVHFAFFPHLLWRCDCCIQRATNESILLEAFGWPACRREERGKKKIGDCALFSLCARSGLQISQHHRTDVRKLRGMLEVYQRSQSCRSETGNTYWLIHIRGAHQKYITSRR